MTKTTQKVAFNNSREIPFSKLVLSQSNVRRHKTGVSIEELAEDIARRGLLQSLGVRPIIDEAGAETGMFEVPAGGRRFRAFELLVKQKRMAKTQAIPCIVRTEGLAEEDSLAENTQRQALHPLDQYRAFQTLRDKGLSDDEIAARFFVSTTIVKQRLKLAAVSPKLLDLYGEDELSLDQLMAFTVTHDHKRQEKVWDALSRGYSKDAYQIRRELTQGTARADNRRALFVGIDAYEAAGGAVLRDLFTEDRGGWLTDPALLDRLVDEKLKREAGSIAAEGWKWIEVAAQFPYGHDSGLRRLAGESIAITDEERATRDALRAEQEAIEAKYSDAGEFSDEVDERLGQIEAALATFEERPVRYDLREMTCAGVFVSLNGDGELQIERGFVRPEDTQTLAATAGPDHHGAPADEVQDRLDVPRVPRAVITIGGANAEAGTVEEEDGARPLSDRLITELTAHRTLAIRDAMGQQFDQAFLAVLHVLALSAFYHSLRESCVEISLNQANFSAQAPGLNDTASARAIEARHQYCLALLPKKPEDLWGVLNALSGADTETLFAHCASLGINAVHEPFNRTQSRSIHADALARALSLDMASDWSPTVENYLGRVSKARIIEAVTEARDEKSAQLIAHLKKGDMAREAERLLEGTRWLPEPLRIADVEAVRAAPAMQEPDALPEFLSADDEAPNGLIRLQAAE
jgi:ParB family transcriptional regulator, chromosome partitioning protein